MTLVTRQGDLWRCACTWLMRAEQVWCTHCGRAQPRLGVPDRLKRGFSTIQESEMR